MPRIPVRTTPYHTLPRCTRHYKSKRDLILRALGKASFINGSQFVIAWISPKGEVDVYASELLQAAVTPKEGGVLSRKELEREAVRIRGEMGRRWDEIRRLEEAGEAMTMEDEAEEGADEDMESDDVDPDRTMVDSTPAKPTDSKKPSPTGMMSSFPASAPRSSTPSPPMHTLTLAPSAVENYYASRFAALQQATCKLVVKAWIKVIEPKKQMKYPYNKGEELKPAWWPEGVRHREPDHLSKTERLTLLCSIVRSPLISVSRLELSTAEAGAFISRPRQSILREVYLVAKEEEKRRKENDQSSDLNVHLPHLPVSPSAVSPEQPEKRSHSTMETSHSNKENLDTYSHSTQKRMKHQVPRLAALQTSTNNYDGYTQPFTFSPSSNISSATPWRDSSALPAHTYSHDAYSNEYTRSSNNTEPERYHPNHLAPILNHSHSHASHTSSHSPIDSPAFGHSAAMSNSGSNAGSAYYRGSYMQQQQMDYLHTHSHHQEYDYGSPYLAEGGWDNSFAATA